MDRGFWSRYWIVSDYTGNVIDDQQFFPIGNFLYEVIDIIPDREYKGIEMVISCEPIRLLRLSGKTEKLPG